MVRPCKASLWSLPEHLLCEAFALVDFQDRATTLPLVCKRFAELLSTGSAAWAEVAWTLQVQGHPGVARCCGFLTWLRPRASHLHKLTIVVERVAAAALNAIVLPDMAMAALQVVLVAARYSLEWLKLVLPSTLHLGTWPVEMPHLQTVSLAALGIQCGRFLQAMPRLQQAELYTPEGWPPTFATGCEVPSGITRLVMVPAPSRLPECVLKLRQLAYLDIGGGDFEPGAVDDALPHFTSLRTLALDRGTLQAVPRQLSALTGLQVLSLHQALDGAEIDRSSFAVLSCLTALSTLSISGCALHEVPLGVAQLTTLKVLHTEGALRSLDPGPYCSNLRLLSIDWQVLFRDPGGILTRTPSLRRLCICLSYLPFLNPWEYAQLHGAAEVLQALAAHPALESVAVVVFDGDMNLSSVRLTEFLVKLSLCRPVLDVKVVPGSAFFLTEGVGAGVDL
ncbi:hypothetical protein N2152v2_008985 [Parachlorella kessleri]